MNDQEKARAARIKMDAARDHLGKAIEAISGPKPDWTRAQAHVDMAWDIVPVLKQDGE